MFIKACINLRRLSNYFTKARYFNQPVLNYWQNSAKRFTVSILFFTLHSGFSFMDQNDYYDLDWQYFLVPTRSCLKSAKWKIAVSLQRPKNSSIMFICPCKNRSLQFTNQLINFIWIFKGSYYCKLKKSEVLIINLHYFHAIMPIFSPL